MLEGSGISAKVPWTVKSAPELIMKFATVPTASAEPSGLKVTKRSTVVSPALSVSELKSKDPNSVVKGPTATALGASSPPP